jgi:hypothetical protein
MPEPRSPGDDMADVTDLRKQVEVNRRKKWEKGRQEHGPVMVLDPLVELGQEFLDSINYSRILQDDSDLAGYAGYFHEIETTLRRFAIGILEIQRRKKRTYVATEYTFK